MWMRRNIKKLCVGALGCAVFALLLFGVVSGRFIFGAGDAERIEHFLDALSRSGAEGFLLVVALLVLIAFTGFLPASLIGIVSGSIYGLGKGFAVSTLATILGAWVSFAISRSLFRDVFERLFARRASFRHLEDEMVKGGWRFVCLLRMSPIMPFALTSYALGLSGVSARNYMLGTIASLPALFGYVCMGWFARHSISGKFSDASYVQWTILGTGIVATIFLAFYMKRLVSRAAALSRQEK